MNQAIIFGDIHANLPALEAVQVDMGTRGQSNFYCLGDLVGYGAFPNEVIAALREWDVLTLMGNYDQSEGNSSDDCGCAYTDPVSEALGKRSIAWTNEHTTEANKRFLRQLLRQIPLQLGDLQVVLVHSSPRRINEYLFEDRPDRSLERFLDMAKADVLVCGHTHLPYHRILPSGRQVVNAGSVGKSKDGDSRAYGVILNGKDRTLEVNLIQVAYDVKGAAQAIEASTMPHEYTQMLRTGTG